MNILRRILNDLASDLDYRFSQEEEDLYFDVLSSYPLSLVSELALEILESGDYAGNHFPSLAFFKSQLGGKIKANQLKEELHGKTNDGLYDHSHIWRNG